MEARHRQWSWRNSLAETIIGGCHHSKKWTPQQSNISKSQTIFTFCLGEEEQAVAWFRFGKLRLNRSIWPCMWLFNLPAPHVKVGADCATHHSACNQHFIPVKELHTCSNLKRERENGGGEISLFNFWLNFCNIFFQKENMFEFECCVSRIQVKM